MTSASRPPSIPRRLTAAKAEPVLVADFLQPTGAPRFSEVLSDGDHGHPICAIDPITDLADCGEYLSLAELAEGYADAFRAAHAGSTRSVVVGYCAAAALSLHIAGRLAAFTEVLAVLVRPTWPDTDMISSDFASFRAGLAAADESFPDLVGDPVLTLTRLERVLEADLHARARTLGLEERSSGLADLLARYRAWLGFLLASRSALQEPWPEEFRLVVLTGTAEYAHIPWLKPDSYQVKRLPLPDDELLAMTRLARSSLAQIRDHDI